jgi:hypothetical protein
LIAPAVKVTVEPEHIVFVPAVILTEGVTLVVVVMVKAFDVAVVEDKQPALLVKSNVNTSPLLIALVV